MQEKNTFEQLKSIINQKEGHIKQLENQLNDLKENLIQSKPVGSVQQFFIHSDSKEDKNEMISTFNQVDWDKTSLKNNNNNTNNNNSSKRETTSNNLFRNRSDSTHFNERETSSR